MYGRTRSLKSFPLHTHTHAYRWADQIIAILPWEAEEEGHSILAQPLMEQVLCLGLDEQNFSALSDEERAQFPFKLENHVDVITRLLPLDPNLAKVRKGMGKAGLYV
jgi:hypothetical protein